MNKFLLAVGLLVQLLFVQSVANAADDVMTVMLSKSQLSKRQVSQHLVPMETKYEPSFPELLSTRRFTTCKEVDNKLREYGEVSATFIKNLQPLPSTERETLLSREMSIPKECIMFVVRVLALNNWHVDTIILAPEGDVVLTHSSNRPQMVRWNQTFAQKLFYYALYWPHDSYSSLLVGLER